MATKSLGHAAADLAARRARLMVQSLGQGADRHRSVHRARKAIRRLRSVLALGRESFGSSFDAIDNRLKVLARGLSALRDAHVAAEAAMVLAQGEDAAAWQQVGTTLQHRRDTLLADALLKDPAFATRRRRATSLAGRITALPWERLSVHDLCKALSRSIRRARKAADAADSTRSAKDAHRWRRRVRQLRFQLEALQNIESSSDTRIGCLHEGNKTSPRSLSKLTDKLGWCQDLQILKSALRGVADPARMSQLKCRMQQELESLRR
jgi:CHAD domain-containing protein